MPGGPIYPYSVYPVTPNVVFENVHTTLDVTQDAHDIGLGVYESITTDGIWRLRFGLPPVFPSGTPNLRLKALANATSGSAQINPQYRSVAIGEALHGTALNAVGTSALAWGAGDANVLQVLLFALTVDPLVESETLAMDLVFESSGWTLAEVSTWFPTVIWI